MNCSRMRILLLLCSVMLFMFPTVVSADTETGPPFKFNFEQTFIPEGQVGCVDVIVEGFDDVFSFEFGILFDTNLFSFAGTNSTLLDENGLNGNVATSQNTGEEVLTIAYFGVVPVSIADGSIAFSVCFEAIGNDGETTSIEFTDLSNGNPAQIFATNGAFQTPELCLVPTNIIIGDMPTPLEIMATTQASSCQESGDGVLELTISGGVEPYNLLVTNCNTGDIIIGPEDVAPSVVLINLNAGEYCIELSDNSVPSATISTMEVVANNGPSLGATFQNMEPTCNGFSNGSIEAFAILNAVQQNNPNPDFNFVWTQSGGMTPVVGPVLDNIGAGSYEVQITEIASGCSVTQSIFLTEPAAINVDIAVSNETCLANGMDGEVAAVTTGGVGGYDFMWDDMNSSTDSLVTGLGQGTYTVVVRDANGCAGTDTDDITAPVPPQILGFDSISISCPGAMDGELEVLFMDGSAMIDRVEWFLPGGGIVLTGPRITNLGPGDYLVTVTGLDNCASSMPVSLGAAEGVMIDLANSSTGIADCPDYTDGSISVALTGGVGPFTFFVDGVEQLNGGSNIPALSPGDYDIFVIDASGCQSPTETFTVDRVPDITADFIDIQGVNCFEGPGGSATVVAMNGTGPFFYTWDNSETDATATSLVGDSNFVRIVSGNCFLDTFVIIPQPTEIMVEPTITNVSCFGESDGRIDLSISGGTGAYSVSANAPVVGTSLIDLTAGFYTVIVSDANNCEVPANLGITEPDSLDAFIADIQNISCNGDADGLLVTGVNGGTGNPTFAWSTGSQDVFNTNTALLAGDYIVTVTDANGCQDTAMATIVEPIAIDAEIAPIAEAPCFGQQTNLNVVQATGGNGGPYTYTVNAGPAIPLNNEIPVFAGEYTITVFDNRGCRRAYEVEAFDPPPIQVSAGVDQEINLGGSTFIFGTADSSVGIDSFYWVETPGEGTLSCYDCLNPTANPLVDSNYELFVVDNNGCMQSDEIFINVDSDRNVYIPNVFSPYKVDGFNDFFSPFTGIGVDQVLSLDIYDRWGEQVFTRENFTPGSSEAQGWDGKFRGKLASKGVYFYIARIQFIDGVILTYRGDVTIL